MPELTCEQVNERLAALCHWYIIEVDVMNGGFGEADGPVTREVRWQKGARLNPAFVCWLMNWPWWWTQPARISFAAAEMELYRSRLRSRLSLLLEGLD